MNQFINFYENTKSVPHSSGKKHYWSHGGPPNVTIFFLNSVPYTPKDKVRDVDKYMKAVIAGRIKLVGYNDVLGYEIDGMPVYFPLYYEKNPNKD